MTVLVIGGCGFIGSHVAEALCSEGKHLVLFDRNADKSWRILPGARYVKGEFGNRGELEKVFEEDRITEVVHLAASTLPSSSNQDPEFDVRSNVEETIAVLGLCVRHRIRKFLFMSSGGTVYGIPKYLPIDESHPTDPITSYGITKLAIEKYLQLYHHLYDLQFVALRAANPYGPRQVPTVDQGVIAVFAYRILRGEEIVVWGDGTVMRDYFHVVDLADLCVRALRSDASGIYNAGSGVGMSLLDLLGLLEKKLGVRPRVRFEPGRTLDVPAIVLNCSRTMSAFGWKPRVPLDQGLSDVVRWLKTEWMHSGA